MSVSVLNKDIFIHFHNLLLSVTDFVLKGKSFIKSLLPKSFFGVYLQFTVITVSLFHPCPLGVGEGGECGDAPGHVVGQQGPAQPLGQAGRIPLHLLLLPLDGLSLGEVSLGFTHHVHVKHLVNGNI